MLQLSSHFGEGFPRFASSVAGILGTAQAVKQTASALAKLFGLPSCEGPFVMAWMKSGSLGYTSYSERGDKELLRVS